MAIDHLKRSGLQRRVICGVVTEFCPWQLVQPVTRAVTRETSQVHGYGLVHRFGLPVCLWVERSAHPKLDASVAKEIAPHMPREDRVAIADDGLGKSMEAHDVLEESSCH